jgi:hypothetical protein
MRRVTVFRFEFVEFIPGVLEHDVLYISIPYATASHLCACGCGNKVVTPFSPTDWKLIFEGKTVSLTPSIGNWSFACQSHYWIVRNRVRWASKMTEEKIEEARSEDRNRKLEYYDDGTETDDRGAGETIHGTDAPSAHVRPYFKRLWRG